MHPVETLSSRAKVRGTEYGMANTLLAADVACMVLTWTESCQVHPNSMYGGLSGSFKLIYRQGMGQGLCSACRLMS